MSNLSTKMNELLNSVAGKTLCALTANPANSPLMNTPCACCGPSNKSTTTLEFQGATSGATFSLCDEHLSEILHELPGLAEAVLKLKGLSKPPVDIVNHPPHYQSKSGLEVIDVIEAFELNFHLGAATKYILRHDKKGDPIIDLKKAIWYLEREIARRTTNDDISS